LHLQDCLYELNDFPLSGWSRNPAYLPRSHTSHYIFAGCKYKFTGHRTLSHHSVIFSGFIDIDALSMLAYLHPGQFLYDNIVVVFLTFLPEFENQTTFCTDNH
jgi:hypothetical protein